MRLPATMKFWSVLLAGLTLSSGPLGAAVDCLSDQELRIVVRSVYTRAIGRVMRACAAHYPALDERAREAATGLLTSYSEQMRANRLAANSIMMRVHGDDWNEKFEKMLVETTASDEAWARAATKEECDSEVERVESMVDADNYAKVMAEGIPGRLYDAERISIPRCE